jgi:hypothetical protein
VTSATTSFTRLCHNIVNPWVKISTGDSEYPNPREETMDEETLRKMAIEQYLQGKEPVLIYKELGRTKPWFFKWLNRYQAGDKEWFQDRSRAPLTTPHQTSSNLIALVKKLRL